MRLLITILFFLSVQMLNAQSSFARAYDMDAVGSSFRNMLLVEDTLVVIGQLKREDNSPWGLFFTKMDTTGNILVYREYFDLHHPAITSLTTHGFIRTQDGGYALLAQYNAQPSSLLVKLDGAGNLEYVTEHVDDTPWSYSYSHLIESSGGYLRSGKTYATEDAASEGSLIYTDKQGEIKWEVAFGTQNDNDSFGSLYEINENKFFITATTSSPLSGATNFFEDWRRCRAFVIDTLSNLEQIWEGPQEFIDNTSACINSPIRDVDGNWVHLSSYRDVISPTQIEVQGEITKRDTNFNVIWNARFGPPANGFGTRLSDFAPTPDGTWVAVGRYFTPIDDEWLGGWQGGWMVKASADGTPLWSRQDSVFWDSAEGVEHVLSAVIVLPSGSIVAAGKIDHWGETPPRSYGWLIKVDSNGCLETDCPDPITSTNANPLIEFDFDIFPNPTTNEVRITLEGDFQVQLFDNYGHLLEAHDRHQDTSSISVAHLPAGVYFIRVQKGHLSFTKKIVKSG